MDLLLYDDFCSILIESQARNVMRKSKKDDKKKEKERKKTLLDKVKRKQISNVARGVGAGAGIAGLYVANKALRQSGD